VGVIFILRCARPGYGGYLLLETQQKSCYTKHGVAPTGMGAVSRIRSEVLVHAALAVGTLLRLFPGMIGCLKFFNPLIRRREP